MADKRNIIDAIRELAKNDEEVYSIVCTVTSVDNSNKTCVCEPINGNAELLDVKLMAQNKEGFLLIPKVNSMIVVTMINKHTGYVAMCSEVSEVQLNGDNYDGLIKINELTTKLNALVNAINVQLPLIATGIVAGGGAYTPTLMSVFNKSDYENLTVKQGNG
jgi:hypothetical protein